MPHPSPHHHYCRISKPSVWFSKMGFTEDPFLLGIVCCISSIRHTKKYTRLEGYPPAIQEIREDKTAKNRAVESGCESCLDPFVVCIYPKSWDQYICTKSWSELMADMGRTMSLKSKSPPLWMHLFLYKYSLQFIYIVYIFVHISVKLTIISQLFLSPMLYFSLFFTLSDELFNVFLNCYIIKIAPF